MTSGILASLTGTLHKDPLVRTAKTGKPFTVITIKYRDGDGFAFAQATAFSTHAQEALAVLHEGEGVVITGYAKLGVWTPPKGGDPRPSLQLLVEGALPLKAKPKPSNDDGAKKPRKPSGDAANVTSVSIDPDLNDEPSILWGG